MNAIAWNDLNELACQWYALDPQKDAARKQLLQQKISGGLYEFLRKGQDVSNADSQTSLDLLTDLWISFSKYFDPGKSSLEQFVKGRLGYIRTDQYYENTESINTTNPETGKRERKIISTSLTVQTDDGEDEEIDITSENDPEKIIEDADRELALIHIFSTLVINMRSRLPGRKNNDDTFRYYCMFFTDGMTQAIQECKDLSPYLNKEREIMTALCHDEYRFMDFFLTEKCRCIRRIAVSDVKLLSEMVAGAEKALPSRPLPADAYIAFLAFLGKTVTRQAITNQRKEYKKFFGSVLPAAD